VVGFGVGVLVVDCVVVLDVWVGVFLCCFGDFCE